MRKTILYTCVLLLSVWLSSCCFNTKCDTGSMPPDFRVINALNGKDLILGPDAVYNRDEIRFYSLSANDTVFYTWFAGGYSNGTAADSFLRVDCFKNAPARVFVQLSPLDTDTLDFSYTATNSRCCGSYTYLSRINYNNVQTQRSTGLVILYK